MGRHSYSAHDEDILWVCVCFSKVASHCPSLSLPLSLALYLRLDIFLLAILCFACGPVKCLCLTRRPPVPVETIREPLWICTERALFLGVETGRVIGEGGLCAVLSFASYTSLSHRWMFELRLSFLRAPFYLARPSWLFQGLWRWVTFVFEVPLCVNSTSVAVKLSTIFFLYLLLLTFFQSEMVLSVTRGKTEYSVLVSEAQ